MTYWHITGNEKKVIVIRTLESFVAYFSAKNSPFFWPGASLWHHKIFQGLRLSGENEPVSNLPWGFYHLLWEKINLKSKYSNVWRQFFCPSSQCKICRTCWLSLLELRRAGPRSSSRTKAHRYALLLSHFIKCALLFTRGSTLLKLLCTSRVKEWNFPNLLKLLLLVLYIVFPSLVVPFPSLPRACTAIFPAAP